MKIPYILWSLVLIVSCSLPDTTGDGWDHGIKRLLAGDRGNRDEFGRSVAIDGDVIVVGAPLEDGADTDRGAAYVFSRDLGGPDNWGQLKKFVPPQAKSRDYVGYSTALSDDYALAGAKAGDGAVDDDTDTGAVYIFRDIE